MRTPTALDWPARACLLLMAALASIAMSEQSSPLPRIGILVPPIESVFEGPLRESLRELSYVDGKSVSLDIRRSEGPQQEWRSLAEELVRSKVDLIIAIGTPAARAAMDATTSIPVVFGVGDAVNTGLAASLARPGANGTGVATMSTELSAKRLELLLQLVPKARHVVFLYNPLSPLGPRLREQVQEAARTLRVQLDVMEAKDAREIEIALVAIKRSRPDGFLVSSELLFLTNRGKIIQAVNQARLPTVFPWRAYVVEGGVLSYGASNEEAIRRLALYVDRILKGARPADLPIEQLSKLHLVIDLRAAKAQGISIPESLRVLSDEVIR